MDGDDIKECNRMMIKVIIFVLLCCVDQLWSVREHGQLQSLKLRQSQSLQRLLLQSSSLVTAALLPLLTTNPHKALAVGSKSSTKKKTWVERVASKNGRVLHLGLQQDDVFYPAW